MLYRLFLAVGPHVAIALAPVALLAWLAHAWLWPSSVLLCLAVAAAFYAVCFRVYYELIVVAHVEPASLPHTWRAPSTSELAALMATRDAPADVLVAGKLFGAGPPLDHVKVWAALNAAAASRSGNAALVQAAHQIVAHTNTLPGWVERERLQRGQLVYQNNVGFMGMSLLVALCESYLFPADAKVLFFGGGLTSSLSRTASRALHTGHWLHYIMTHELGPGSDAAAWCAQVRLLHAYVRSTCDASGEFGGQAAPVNQATQIGTLLLFCQASIESMAVMGVPLRQQEKDDYWHLWRYVGYLIGIDESAVPLTYNDGLVARASPFYCERQQPDDTSRLLLRNTLVSVEGLPFMLFSTNVFLNTLQRFWRGPLCQDVRLPQLRFATQAHWWIKTFIYASVALVNRTVPGMQAWHNTWFGSFMRRAYGRWNALPSIAAPARCPMGFDALPYASAPSSRRASKKA